MDFTKKYNPYTALKQPSSFYFCDNKKDANDCAQLVIDKIKQATATSLWWFEKHNENLPQINDIHIITDWNGIEKAIIKTTKVEQIAFEKISSAFAKTEGEGDKSLAYWKKVHWDYYAREMKPYDEKPDDKMILVCEYFKTIWTV